MVLVNNKEIVNALHHWNLQGEFPSSQRISHVRLFSHLTAFDEIFKMSREWFKEQNV